jgi:hypothetical protein
MSVISRDFETRFERTEAAAEQPVPTVLDGLTSHVAIPVDEGEFIVLTHASSPGAYTLAAPVPGNLPAGDDGKELYIMNGSAVANVVTVSPVTGVVGGTYGTITFTSAAIGDGIVLKAYNGKWYVKSEVGTITIA